MSIQFQPLPLDIFTEKQRPHIARLNAKLRELCALEGTLRNPLSTKRSDNTIARRDTEQVHVTRITPDIMSTVSGASTIVGTPALTFGLTNVVGTTTTALSINSALALFSTDTPLPLAATAIAGLSATAANAGHVHIFPPTLRSTANASTLALTDDGTNQTATSSLGNLTLQLPASGTFFISPDTTTGGNPTCSVLIRPGAGNNTGLQCQYTTANLSSDTVSPWNVVLTHTSQMVSSTVVGYDMTTFSFTPSAGSDSANVIYGGRLIGPLVNNATGGFSEIATLFLQGSRRLVSNPTVTAAYGLLLECPAISGTTQAGIYIKQRTAQATATNRYGIFVEAQNSGTNRYAFYGVSDILYHAGTIKHAGVLAGLYGATPTVQFGTTGTASGFTAGTSTAVTVDSTYTGNTGSLAYTIGDAIRALKLLGALAY